MQMTGARLWLAVTVVLVMMGWAVTRARAVDAAPLPQVGQSAPEFTLPSQDGTPTSLSAFKGKWVVLYFYPKDMTTGCTIEAHNFQQDEAKYAKLHAVIVGVSVDTVDSHKQFCAKEGLNFKLLSDADKKVVAEYGSLGSFGPMQIAKRNTFLINPQGKIIKVWTGVDPQHHSAEVLSELEHEAHA
jgi:thioredoxin-dependent peroxiredoxin